MTGADVVVIGGGPAGSIVASLLAQAGHDVVVLERDIHPRDHVGESLTPSTTPIFERIGFLDKIESAGFVHKPGACWTAPRSPVGKYLALRLAEFPPPGATQSYTYNVERDTFDALLLRHAHELGARVVQGARVEKVRFEDGRATGVTVNVADGWEHDVAARFVVDATGRRSLIASQLGLRVRDPMFNQFAVYSWFRGVEPNPNGTEGMLFLHFLGLERGWAWQIPLRDDVWSVGVVTDRADFRPSGMTTEAFFEAMVDRNANLAFRMRHATRVRPWWIEGDYTYRVDSLRGPGWVLIGDALRFVDPVFSTGVDVAAYSALYAFEALSEALAGRGEDDAFEAYERRVTEGTQAWYDLISLFYRLQNLFTAFAVRQRYREAVVRILQGNLYVPESLARARELIALMEDAYAQIMKDDRNLLRPGALRQG